MSAYKGNGSGWAMALVIAGAMGLAACGADGGYGAYAPVMDGELRGEVYDQVTENTFMSVEETPVSTFSIDVDTASYTLMRRDVEDGRLPRADGVRPEEYLNYFDYGYPQPDGPDPFSISLEVAPSPFGPEGSLLMQVGLKGESRSIAQLKPTSLVFLVDVSGSMQSSEKLPMVQRSINTLINHLRPDDTVAIVTYAGSERVALQPTAVREHEKILKAVKDLKASGSTNADAGIVKAYQLAEAAKKPGGNNRVVIMTDGDFNVGRTGDELFKLIDQYRERQISLTCVGYGLGNFNDYHMENISNRGNGNYFYIDSLAEAERVFGDELPGTLEVIAADVKIQVEFDPRAVSRYRLIGYENRLLDEADFDDDFKDAGEVGPGHTVTALYEIEPGEAVDPSWILAEVRLRYKAQYGVDSKKLVRRIKRASVHESFKDASKDLRWAAAVAEYSEILRRSQHSEGARFEEVKQIAEGAQTPGDPKQAQFMDLMGKAQSMWR